MTSYLGTYLIYRGLNDFPVGPAVVDFLECVSVVTKGNFIVISSYISYVRVRLSCHRISGFMDRSSRLRQDNEQSAVGIYCQGQSACRL